MIAFTAVTALASWAGVWVSSGQLREMASSSADTSALVEATVQLAAAGKDQAAAAKSQAKAMEKLKDAGEAQAKAMDSLKDAGQSQALSTQNLADNGKDQLVAIRETANATKLASSAAIIQSDAIRRQSDATILSSKATDRLSVAATSQSNAVMQSLDIARDANAISSRASKLSDRPWLGATMPGIIVPKLNTNYEYMVEFLNTGKSPAIRVIHTSQFEIVESPFNLQNLLKCAENCQTITAFPGGGFGLRKSIPAALMTEQQITRLSSRADTIVLRTRIDYFDQYGDAHTSVSCSYYLPDKGFTSCRGGNDAN